MQALPARQRVVFGLMENPSWHSQYQPKGGSPALVQVPAGSELEGSSLHPGGELHHASDPASTIGASADASGDDSARPPQAARAMSKTTPPLLSSIRSNLGMFFS
jgi:hypothetical protein